MSSLTTNSTLILPHSHPVTSEPRSSCRCSRSTMMVTRCGPRDNRHPIIRGRTLSSEAILAVQSLKRRPSQSQQQQQQQQQLLLSRLLKPDLVAAFDELLRQDLPLLALSLILPVLRQEPTFTLLSSLPLYADLFKSLAKNNLRSPHLVQLKDRLVRELDAEGGITGSDLRGPARLVKSLMAAGCGDGVMEVYGLMKKGGCVPNDYLFNYIINGLRRLREEESARVVEGDFQDWVHGGGWGLSVSQGKEEEEEEDMEAVPAV